MIQKINRIIKVVLFFSFIVSVILQPVTGYSASIWEKRQQAVQEMKGTAQEETITEVIEETVKPEVIQEEAAREILAPDTVSAPRELSAGPLSPSEIIIPDQYGTIIDTYDGTNGRLIVHIQDAHVNYEGQINLANIIESLIVGYDLNLILKEGGFTNANFMHLRNYGSLDARKRAAERLLKDAVIAGEDYLSLTTDYDMSFQGIEDKELYDLNSEAMWELDKFKAQAIEYIDGLIKVTDALKPRIYNDVLIELDAKKKDYNNETIDLIEYYEYLYSKAEENNVPLYVFPNFQNLVKASDIEKKIDMAKIRTGDASMEETDLYNEYLELTRSLNVNALFKEEPKIEGFLEDTMTENPDQRTLLKISKALGIMRNLLRIKVVPEEYKYFADNKKDFDAKVWSEFLGKKAGELNLPVVAPANYYIINDNIAKIEEFYETALEREKAFITKTDERMEQDEAELAVLIAGGFHTPTLTKLLEDAGYSYVVVSPKVTTETDEELYRAALRR